MRELPKNWKSQELRSGNRLPAGFRVPVTLERRKRYGAKIFDLSISGARLVCDQPPPIGSVLFMDVSTGGRPLLVESEVVRSHDEHSDQVGVRWNTLHPEDQKHVESMLAELNVFEKMSKHGDRAPRVKAQYQVEILVPDGKIETNAKIADVSLTGAAVSMDIENGACINDGLALQIGQAPLRANIVRTHGVHADEQSFGIRFVPSDRAEAQKLLGAMML